MTFALFRQAPTQGYGRLTIERSQVTPRTPFMANELTRLVYQAPSNILKGELLSLRVISCHRPELLVIPTDRGVAHDGKPIRNKVRQGQRMMLIKGEYWASHGMPDWLSTASCIMGRNLLETNFPEPVSDSLFCSYCNFQDNPPWWRAYTQMSPVLRGPM